MDVYFAGSIRGATFEGKEACYRAIIDAIREHHTLLSEHAAVTGQAEKLNDVEIYQRDMDWIANSDAMIAEVSAPSLGVGYELHEALSLGVPVLCLHKANVRVSAMLTGNPDLQMCGYDTPEAAAAVVRDFLETRATEMYLDSIRQDW